MFNDLSLEPSSTHITLNFSKSLDAEHIEFSVLSIVASLLKMGL